MSARLGVQKWLASANVKVACINAFNAMSDQFQQIGDSRWKLRIDPEKSRDHTLSGAACVWWVVTGSNCRHSACKADALPTELTTRNLVLLATLWLRGLKSTKARYLSSSGLSFAVLVPER